MEGALLGGQAAQRQQRPRQRRRAALDARRLASGARRAPATNAAVRVGVGYTCPTSAENTENHEDFQ